MRSRYPGQLVGDEKNSNTVSGHYADNDLVEGKEAATVRRFMETHQYEKVDAYVSELRRQGWSEVRIQAVLSKATVNLRL